MKEYGHEFAEFLYHTPSEFEQNGGLWIIRSGHNRAKPNYQVGPKVIECYSIHAVTSGSVSFTFAGQTVQLHKDDLFCLYPGLRYSYQIAEDEQQLRMYWLAFQGNQAERFLDRIGFSRMSPYVTGHWTPEHEQTINRIHGMLRDKSQFDEVLLQSGLYQLFEAMSSKEAEISANKGSSDWLKRCIQYIDTHYMEGIAVADVVEVARVHRSHLYQGFSRLLGFSPMQYLIKLRMEKSGELLKDSGLNVTEIALSVGYPDLFSFSRAFRKYYGISPKQYQMSLIGRQSSRR